MLFGQTYGVGSARKKEMNLHRPILVGALCLYLTSYLTITDYRQRILFSQSMRQISENILWFALGTGVLTSVGLLYLIAIREPISDLSGKIAFLAFLIGIPAWFLVL